MRRVAIIAVADTPLTSESPEQIAPEMVFDVSRRAVEASGLDRRDIDVTISGSSDMLEGRSFNFAFALEAMGAHPPIQESHVEMDGAWAAFYAWVKIQAGEADSALVIAWGKSSEGSLHHVLNRQLDPIALSPLGLDRVSSAALQADAWLRRTGRAASDLDRVVARARERMQLNPRVCTALPEIQPAAAPVASPLKREHCPPVTDGACALVLAAESKLPAGVPAAWICGADHRTESGALGARDLSRSPSARTAAERARGLAGWSAAQVSGVDVAELSASFAHQVPMLVEELELGPNTVVNPSGGALIADPLLVTGLIRLGECARQVTGRAGAHQRPGARRGLAHATAGHALQQNLIWLLEGAAP